MDSDPDTRHSVFKIGELTVEPTRNVLSRNGKTYTLEPRVMDVLCALVDRAGEVVSREAMIERIWNVEFGGDESLTRAISILRKTFRQAGQSRDLLETIPKRGYLLNLPDAQIKEPSTLPLAKAAQRLNWIFVTGPVLIVLLVAFIGYRIQSGSTFRQVDRSLAVLPFSDMSPAGDQTYFSDGISVELMNVLARVEGLHVASRTSSFAFKEQDISIRSIANQLGVRHVLEGSVRKSGDTLRITAQLIDAQTDQRLWSQSFDRTLNTDNIFAIQDEISRAIVEQLGMLIGGETPAGLPAEFAVDTQSLKAYDLFLQGRNVFFHRNNVDDALKGIGFLEQAVELDPEFARAWEILAGAYWSVGRGPEFSADYYTLSAKVAEKALSLNPDLGFAYAVRARVLFLSRVRNGEDIKMNEIVKNFDLAVQNDPNLAIVFEWRAVNDIELGYFDQAAADFERCLELDSKASRCKRHLAAVYLYLGRTEEAVQMLEQGLKDGTGIPDIRFGPYYAAHKDRASITKMVQSVLSFGNLAWFHAPLVELILNPELAEVKRPEIERMIANTEQPINEASLNYIYFVIGDYDKMSRRASIAYMWQDVEKFRNTPERKQIFRTHGLVKYWREHGFPPKCRALGDIDFKCN